MEKLAKTEGMPIVETGLDAPVVTDEQAMATLEQATGLTNLPPKTIQSMADLGIYVRGVGVLRKQRGEVLVTQAWLNNALQVMTKELLIEHGRGSGGENKARPSILRSYAAVIAQLASAKTDSQHLALELEKVAAPTGKPDDVERPRNIPFGPGPVISAEQVHIHEAKKELPPPANGA